MRIKKETNGRGAICIDAVGYEAIGHAGDGDGNNNKGHDHSKVSNPAYEPANPLQVINWMCQTAKKYSTISIPGVYGSAYDKFPILFPQLLRSHIVPLLLIPRSLMVITSNNVGYKDHFYRFSASS